MASWAFLFKDIFNVINHWFCFTMQKWFIETSFFVIYITLQKNYAVPLKILFQYSHGNTFVFSSHIVQRGFAWSKGKVIFGVLL